MLLFLVLVSILGEFSRGYENSLDSNTVTFRNNVASIFNWSFNL